jgi:hypothetical protein
MIFESASKLQRIEEVAFSLKLLRAIQLPSSVEVLCKSCSDRRSAFAFADKSESPPVISIVERVLDENAKVLCGELAGKLIIHLRRWKVPLLRKDRLVVEFRLPAMVIDLFFSVLSGFLMK